MDGVRCALPPAFGGPPTKADQKQGVPVVYNLRILLAKTELSHCASS